MTQTIEPALPMESSGQNVWTEFYILVFDMAPKTGWNIFDITLLADKQTQDCGHIIPTIYRYDYPKLIGYRFSVQGAKVTTSG